MTSSATTITPAAIHPTTPLEDLEQRTTTVTPKSRIAILHSIIFSAIGLSSDGYNAQVISSASLVLSRLYPEELTTVLKTRLSQSYFIGVIIGSLIFGCLIDRFSRRSGVVFATLLLILGVILSTAASGVTVQGMIWMLIIGRGVVGAGAGGEYPVCCTSATEASNETAGIRKWRGALIAMTGDFAIDIGIVMGGVLPLIVLVGYGYRSYTSIDDLQGLSGAWRVFLGIGGIVPLSVFYFRYRLVTSTSFKKHNIKSRGGLSFRFYWLVVKRYWRSLSGACLCWFLYDFVAYPAGLLAAPAIDGLSGGKQSLIYSIGYGALINLFTLPGCLLGAYLLDKIGRRNTQIFGFLLQGIIGFVLGGALQPIQRVFPLFVVLYGLFIASAEAGPGVATILIAAEVAPTAVRGHFVGIATAMGKAGAAVGTSVFTALQNQYEDETKGQQVVFYVASGFSILGAILTYFLIPTTPLDLEVEDLAFEEWLASQGVVSPTNINVLPQVSSNEMLEGDDEKRGDSLKDDDDKVEESLKGDLVIS